jgi:hypothetical protein
MGKKRGEYAKNQARNDIKDFIIEIYKKGISSNLQNLKEEQYHDYYIRYVDLINKLNSDENEKKKKSYKVRDAGSQKDYSYFYTEGTRHLNKTKITKETKKENKVRYLQDKSKTLKKKIEREENNLQEIKQEQKNINNDIVDTKDILNRLLAESGAYGLYQEQMLEQYEKLNYYELKAKRKVIYNELLIDLATYVKQQIQLSTQGERTLPSSLIRDLSELCKSFKEIDTGDKFDVSIPKDIMVAVQNNNSITNNTQINNQQDISNINGIPVGEVAKMLFRAQEEK